jgi:hypothetical protein
VAVVFAFFYPVIAAVPLSSRPAVKQLSRCSDPASRESESGDPAKER